MTTINSTAPSRSVNAQVGPGFCGIVLLAMIALFILKVIGVPGVTWLVVFLPAILSVGLTVVAIVTLLVIILLATVAGAVAKKVTR